jgi:hypothetical protein
MLAAMLGRAMELNGVKEKGRRRPVGERTKKASVVHHGPCWVQCLRHSVCTDQVSVQYPPSNRLFELVGLAVFRLGLDIDFHVESAVLTKDM